MPRLYSLVALINSITLFKASRGGGNLTSWIPFLMFVFIVEGGREGFSINVNSWSSDSKGFISESLVRSNGALLKQFPKGNSRLWLQQLLKQFRYVPAFISRWATLITVNRLMKRTFQIYPPLSSSMFWICPWSNGRNSSYQDELLPRRWRWAVFLRVALHRTFLATFRDTAWNVLPRVNTRILAIPRKEADIVALWQILTSSHHNDSTAKNRKHQKRIYKFTMQYSERKLSKVKQPTYQPMDGARSVKALPFPLNL